ncbi:MAG: hypothetical protein ACTHX2_01115 [Microbacterium sp.]
MQNWLVPRYDIGPAKIPDCWWRHGPLVEELSVLHTAWQVAFDETDGGYGPIGWHERLGAALSRETFRKRCVYDEHWDVPARAMSPVDETL